MRALTLMCFIGAIAVYSSGNTQGAFLFLVLAWIFWEDDD